MLGLFQIKKAAVKSALFRLYSRKCKNSRFCQNWPFFSSYRFRPLKTSKSKSFCIFGKYMLVATKNVFTIFLYLLQLKRYSRLKQNFLTVSHLCPGFSHLNSILLFKYRYLLMQWSTTCAFWTCQWSNVRPLTRPGSK